MAVITGVNGDVTIPAGEGALGSGTVLELSKWTLSIDREVHDVSKFGGATNEREFIGGMYDGKGTFEAFYRGVEIDIAKLQEANHAPSATFVLTLDTSKTYTFPAIISGITVTVVKSGLILVSGSFESSGDIIEA